MFGKKVESQVSQTLEEFDKWDFSETYEGIILDFIDYMVEVTKAAHGIDTLEAIDYLMSDRMNQELYYYFDKYTSMVHTPKYSPDDLVIIPKEQ